jgi:hypothetical protein
MRNLSRFKRCSFIRGMVAPHSVDDAYPHMRQCADSHAVTFAFGTFARVLVQCPCFRQGGLPGKLVEDIPQGFDTRIPFMCFGVISALKGDRGSTRECLQGLCIGVASAIITNFGQQSWCQALASSRETLKDGMILMGQKKGTDLLIVGSNVLHNDQQLSDQRQGQARFRSDCHGIGTQVCPTQYLDDPCSSNGRAGVLTCVQRGFNLFERGRRRRLWRWIGLQKVQGRALVQFAKKLECCGVVVGDRRPSTG